MSDSPARVAAITGAARGIGAAIAQRLHHDGWRTFLLDSDAAALHETAAALGAPSRTVVTDVADETAVQAAVNQVREHAGRLDALVCNAGIMIRKPLRQLTLAEWSRVIATNLTSAFLLTRAAEDMLRGSNGAVITIASTRAHMSEPDTEAYSASKGGLLALTHALAVSLGPSVRVNCISPGWIDTKDSTLRPEDHAQHPAGRVGRPEDVASMAAWLLEPGNAFITGSEFIIDGGMTRKMIYVE